MAHDLQKVTLLSADGHAETLDVTDEHPIYVDGQGWTPAGQLAVGNRVFMPDGGVMTVSASEDDYRPDGVTVYNFQVEGDHTYFVADGSGDESFVWVHNATAYTSGENKFASLGREMHNAHADLFANLKYTTRKALPSGRIPDAFQLIKNAAGKVTSIIIRELKPNTARSISRGTNQLRRYGQELSKIHKVPASNILLILDVYVR